MFTDFLGLKSGSMHFSFQASSFNIWQATIMHSLTVLWLWNLHWFYLLKCVSVIEVFPYLFYLVKYVYAPWHSFGSSNFLFLLPFKALRLRYQYDKKTSLIAEVEEKTPYFFSQTWMQCNNCIDSKHESFITLIEFVSLLGVYFPMSSRTNPNSYEFHLLLFSWISHW